ncbi:hypothetical protein FHW04_003208 [Pantoea sp. AN62]|uniref:hypothetical protein n=1 Tax=Pantoea TaxID=53335 RepID=UPI000FE14564|nr:MULTISPECIES: hypothetical protein [Pantoea]MDU4747410.1 hypothetical protein [Pantoea sp.]
MTKSCLKICLSRNRLRWLSARNGAWLPLRCLLSRQRDGAPATQTGLQVHRSTLFPVTVQRDKPHSAT